MDNNYMNQGYQYAPQYEDPNNKPLDIKDWLIVLIVQMIPCIGFIMTLVWAFGSGNVNRKRYCQANLIIMLISFILNILGIILVFTVFAGALATFFAQFSEGLESSLGSIRMLFSFM